MFLKKTLFPFLLFTILGCFVIFPAVLSAKQIAKDCNEYCGKQNDYTMPVGTSCLCPRDNPEDNEEGIIGRATNWIFYIILVLAPLFVLMGAFMIMSGGGYSKKSKSAEGIESIIKPSVSGGKKMIIWAISGLAVALSAKIIYAVVRYLIGQ